MMKWIIAAALVFSSCSGIVQKHDLSDGGIYDQNKYEVDQEEYEMKEVLSRFKSRVVLTEKKRANDRGEKSDLRIAFSGFRSKFVGRIEKKDNKIRPVLFIESQVPSRGLQLYTGDFMPDLALGAIFSGYRFSYPFSSGYPLRRQKSITKHTSFYGSSIRGIALRSGTARSTLLVFMGRVGKWNDEKFTLERQYMSGARIEAGSGRYRAGRT